MCLSSKLRRFRSTAHLFIWPQRTLFLFLLQKRRWPAEPKDSLDCILVTVFLLCSPYRRCRFFSASTAPDTELVVTPSHLRVCDVHSVRNIYLFQRCRFLYSFLISAEHRSAQANRSRKGRKKKKRRGVRLCFFLSMWRTSIPSFWESPLSMARLCLFELYSSHVFIYCCGGGVGG